MNRLFFIITIFIVFFHSCKENKRQSMSITKEITFKKEGELLLKKVITDSVFKTLDIEIAKTEYETQTGLMYRHMMEGNQAMLFIFKKERPRSFYMKNTEFSLDIIYINKKKEIVGIQKNTKPFDNTSLPSNEPVLYVLEINGGLSDSWGITKGDVIEWIIN
ncbi:MAG: DUF192 domain-containing protein [Flavobacteriaceae bacterium]|nr:DUF192 domain-containing protein [Flavobacteriaceae bacterium]MBT3920730.1 DUF192 domain-containing protein [Flavobacteriaceae bacterium]MBT6705253.1 DUF192 domain-containing protein [Flavobacteriaceae bacterium]MBT7241960.1 DUF192 domain-containing protein [Flavobacteriaceae bacterium]|tara:strand:- start:492 stop:977 length:486 start_codon:yes stop_codon:yes gene_type:complete